MYIHYPKKHDFINDPDPTKEFDLIITNPPFCLGEEVLKKVLSYSNQVRIVLLLPMRYLTNKGTGDLLKGRDLHVDALSPDPKFLHDGEEKARCACGWFYFNFTSIKSNITLSIVQNGQVIEPQNRLERTIMNNRLFRRIGSSYRNNIN